MWRALQANPDGVAKVCDWPVNHADLSARKRKLCANEQFLLDNLIKDDKWYDTELAGYWIWAASCWIGSGLTSFGAIPRVGIPGAGVHKLGQIPLVSNGGKGIQEPYNTNIYTWFRDLSERLRYVRVVCGDWTRVCGGNWQDKMSPVGIFFDPPYSADRSEVYHVDCFNVAKDVAKWAHGRGDNKNYRIIIAGYYEEHEWLLKEGWSVERWSTSGGYGNLVKKGSTTKGKENRHKEALFFSPHCIQTERLLFDFDDENV